MRNGKRRLDLASTVPFGIGETKPHHFLEMGRVAWRNRGKWRYAWRVLNDGVCDGCALGTTGLHDFTLEGTHLCMVRLNLLELNTMDAFDSAILGDVAALPRRATELRELGRLGWPMRRRAGEPGFTRIEWSEAIAELGTRLGRADPDRIALYMTSRGITNEVYFAAQKVWRALGSPNVDNAARLCHSPSTAAMKRVLGVAASTCSYVDWYGSDVIVFFGSNPANDQPVALKYLHDAKKLGTKVLVVNPYEEPGMDRYWIPSNAGSAVFGTKIADRFFHVSTGGDLAFIYAVQKLLIAKGGVDRAFIDAHTVGWNEYVAHLDGFDVDELCRRAGATPDDAEALASILAEARTGVFVWSMGLTQHGHAAETIEALLCLGLSKGFVGRDQCGLMPIRGHSGVQGGAEMGAYATVLPGGRPPNDVEADRLAAIWGFRPPAREGLHTVAMIEAAERGELDVLYAIGGNFVDTLPQPERVERALENVPVRVHQDIVLTPKMLLPAREAVYLLPARTRYEHLGGVTETTTERRVIFSPYIPGHVVGEARDEWRILVDIVKAARPDLVPYVHYPDTAAIRHDIAQTIPFYAGIEKLEAKGDHFQWGGRHLCVDGHFGHADGLARFTTAEPRDRTLEVGSFHLATRRGKQFNSMVQAQTDGLTGADRDHVLISGEDMQRLGLHDHEPVRLVSAHGSVEGRAFRAPITPGNLQMHWPEANPLLDPTRVDPGGKVPDYNAVVRIERL